MAGSKHNLHILLPERLWRQAQKRAKRERTTVTALIVEGLKHVLRARRTQERKRP